MCVLLHNPPYTWNTSAATTSVAHFFTCMNEYPQWGSIGSMGTEGSEGATPSDDVPESWGWTLEEATLLHNAVQVRLT